MRFRKRDGISLCIAVLLLLSVAIAPGASQGKTKITFWTWEALGPVAKAFEAAHPDVTVEIVKMGPWDLHDKFLAGLAAGAGLPDVVELVGRRFSSYTSTGKLLDMTANFSKYSEKYVPSTWGVATYKGKIYGLPFDYMPAVVYYRTDLLAEAGVNPSSIVTWDDFIAAGKRVAKGNRSMLPVFVPSTQWGVNNFVMYLQSRGINIYTPEGTVIPNNVKAAETLQWYYDLKAKHGIAMPIKFFEPEFWAAFNADQLAAWPMNPGEASELISEVKSKAGKWGIMPWPLWSKAGPKTTGEWGGGVFTSPAVTSHPSEAMAFIEFISTDPQGALAGWESASDWPAYIPSQRLIKAKGPWFTQYFKNSLVAAIEARTPPTFYRYNWAKTEMIIGSAIDAVFSGKARVAGAWKQVETELSKP